MIERQDGFFVPGIALVIQIPPGRHISLFSIQVRTGTASIWLSSVTTRSKAKRHPSHDGAIRNKLRIAGLGLLDI